MTETNARAVSGICARLDGLPLGLELAAARIPLLPPETLLRHLGRPLEILTQGARDLPLRQRTLRSAIAWSHDLLEPAERRLFRRLSVFVSGCGLDAALAVCMDPEDEVALLDDLDSLVGRSLLRRLPPEGAGDEPRVAMLETIREYAVERLGAAGEKDAMSGAHATFFLRFAEEAEPELNGTERATWLERLERDHDNLCAALDWCASRGGAEMELRLSAALVRFWNFHGHLSEGRARLETALACPGAAAVTRHRARAALGAAHLASTQGDWAAARPRFEESLEMWRELGDARGVAESLLAFGAMEVWRGETGAGRARLEESRAIWSELGEERGQALALFRLGEAAFMEHDYPHARRLLEDSAVMCRAQGDDWQLALPLSYLGEIARCQGDNARAAALYEECLAVNRRLGNRWTNALLLHNLGYVALRRGDAAGARRLFQQSLGLARDVGVRRGVALCLAGLAGVETVAGDPVRAAGLFGASEALLASTGHSLNPADQDELDRNLRALRGRLPQAKLDAGLSEGRGWSLERAVAEASAET